MLHPLFLKLNIYIYVTCVTYHICICFTTDYYVTCGVTCLVSTYKFVLAHLTQSPNHKRWKFAVNSSASLRSVSPYININKKLELGLKSSEYVNLTIYGKPYLQR
jgi:hypothetical protein